MRHAMVRAVPHEHCFAKQQNQRPRLFREKAAIGLVEIHHKVVAGVTLRAKDRVFQCPVERRERELTDRVGAGANRCKGKGHLWFTGYHRQRPALALAVSFTRVKALQAAWERVARSGYRKLFKDSENIMDRSELWKQTSALETNPRNKCRLDRSGGRFHRLSLSGETPVFRVVSLLLSHVSFSRRSF